MPDGDRVVGIRATDEAGNVGEPAEAIWTIDTRAPVVAFGAGPEQPTSTARRAEFQFGADEPVTLECRLDGAEFAPCSSPIEHADLAFGEHTFRVRATDTAGNTGAAESWTWSIGSLPRSRHRSSRSRRGPTAAP